MNWHSEAETWTLAAARDGATVPVVMVGENPTMAAAAAVVIVQPAAMVDSSTHHGGRLTADMEVGAFIVAAGDSGAAVRDLTGQTDAVVSAMVSAGARDIRTDAAYVQAPDAANPRPTRTITATITVTGDC